MADWKTKNNLAGRESLHWRNARTTASLDTRMFYTVTNLITPHALFSPIFLP